MKLYTNFLLFFFSIALASCSVAKGQGGTTLKYLGIMLFPLIIAIAVALYRNEKKQLLYTTNSKGLWNRYKGLLLFIIIVGTAVTIVQTIGEPPLNTTQQKLAYAVQTGDFAEEVALRQQYLNENLSDFKTVHEEVLKMDETYGYYMDYLLDLYRKKYNAYTKTDSDLFYLACHEYGKKHYQASLDYISLIDSLHTNVYLLESFNYFKLGNPTAASKSLQLEIDQKGALEGAYNYLGGYYLQENLLDSLYTLAQRDTHYNYLSPSISDKAYWHKKALIPLIISRAVHGFMNMPSSAVIGALFIFLVWFYYLNYVNPFEHFMADGYTYLTLIGSATSLFVLFPILNAFFSISLNISNSKTFFPSFAHFVFTVGFVEEVVKATPAILIICIQWKHISAYKIIYTFALSGLTFGTLENMLYFNQYDIDLIQVRGLISILMHIILSSIVGYGMAYAKYANKSATLFTIANIFLSSFIHGWFDQFLSDTFGVTVFAILMYMYVIHLWGDMFNNTINVSPSYSEALLHRKISLKSTVMVALLIIILSEYLLTATSTGATVANDRLAASIAETGYLLVFIGVSIGTFDYFEKYWAQVSLPRSISDVVFPRVANNRNFIGHSVLIKSSKHGNKHKTKFPLAGTIVDRKVINRFTNYYLVKLTDSIALKPKFYHDYLLIKIKRYDNVLHDRVPTEVNVYGLLTSQRLDQMNFNKNSAKLLVQGAIFKNKLLN